MTVPELEDTADTLYDKFVDPESSYRSIAALVDDLLTREKAEALWLAVHIAASLDHEDSEALFAALHRKIRG